MKSAANVFIALVAVAVLSGGVVLSVRWQTHAQTHELDTLRSVSMQMATQVGNAFALRTSNAMDGGSNTFWKPAAAVGCCRPHPLNFVLCTCDSMLMQCLNKRQRPSTAWTTTRCPESSSIFKASLFPPLCQPSWPQCLSIIFNTVSYHGTRSLAATQEVRWR